MSQSKIDQVSSKPHFKGSLALKTLTWFNSPAKFYEDMTGHPPYPYQERFLNLWNRPESHKRILCVAAGGTGKTEMLGVAALYIALVLSEPMIWKMYPWIPHDPKEVLILSGSLLQARKVYGYMRGAFSRTDEYKPLVTELRQTDTILRNGGVVKALPNSLTATQGQHCYTVLVDEASLVHDFQLDDCYRIVGAHDGIIVWSGTPTEYASKFVQTYEIEDSKIQKGEKPDWEIFSWSARECPRLAKAYEEAKAKLPEDMVQIFWEGKPYPLTGSLIPRDSMIDAIRGITEFKYNPTLMTTMGIDWGWGDPTGYTIWQTDGNRYYCLEAFTFKETDFDAIHKFIEMKCKDYPPTRIFTDASDKGENLRLIKRGLPVFEVSFSKDKAMMQSRLRDLFVKGMVKIPDEDKDAMQTLIYQLKTYTWEKKSGEDLVDSTMLALKEWLPREDGDPIYIASGRPRRRQFH